jgi:signal transduction histidine kinase
MDGLERGPAKPLDAFARLTGAERGLPWLAAACAATIGTMAAVFVSPLLAKLTAALLMPVLAGWGVGRMAPRVTAGRQYWSVSWAWAIAALVLGTLGAALVHRSVWTPQELIVFSRRDILGLAALVWGCVVAFPLAAVQRQAYREELASLRLAALSAQLKALQAQVEPHFLYNTLANTRYLARHQPERAVQMLDHLIAYLHRALPDMRARASNVRRECELAGHYLALMAIRFGERLHYTVDWEKDLAEAEMPPLLLISLVENAVRHGVEPMPGTVTVEVRAAREGGRIRLAVIDDGPGPGQRGSTGNGVGLRNASDRLRSLYGAAASLTLTRGPDQRTRAELVLPLREPHTTNDVRAAR